MDITRSGGASLPPPALAGIPKGRHLTIDRWSVVGYDRIVGTIRERFGGSAGKTIITSPVMRVRRVGDSGAAVALTQSGSLYWLATPAATFGAALAEHFLDYKSRPLPSGNADQSMRTTVLKFEP